jgi:hypothetical protein
LGGLLLLNSLSPLLADAEMLQDPVQTSVCSISLDGWQKRNAYRNSSATDHGQSRLRGEGTAENVGGNPRKKAGDVEKVFGK